MRKITIATVCFMLLLCGFYVSASANSGHGGAAGGAKHDGKDAGASLSTAIGSHFKNVYTTLDPYQGYAEKYFIAGKMIFFVGEIFLSTPSAFDAYTIITDAGGKVVLLDTHSHTATSPNWFFYYSSDSLPPGNYNVNILVANSGGYLLSPIAFSFVIL
jgi:hypothetical protein